MFFFVCVCDEILLAGAVTGKSSLTSFCAESSEKKNRLKHIFHELKLVVKAKIAQNNSQVSEGGITVKPGQDSIHELII